MLNNLQAVGIHAKLRPLERAAFIKEYAEKSFKNLIQGYSGSSGNAATRLEALIAKGGAYVYGSYPDIDALLQEQASALDRKRREATLHKNLATVSRGAPFRQWPLSRTIQQPTAPAITLAQLQTVVASPTAPDGIFGKDS